MNLLLDLGKSAVHSLLDLGIDLVDGLDRINLDHAVLLPIVLDHGHRGVDEGLCIPSIHKALPLSVDL